MTHKMIVHDAKEFAGAFYERDRSITFRATWPNQMEYVNTKWPHFVEAVRACYAEMLTKHDVTQPMKDAIYEALIAEAPAARSMVAQSPLPLAPNTQAFVGDKRENAVTEENHGKAAQSLAARLRSTTALFPH